MEYEHKTGHFIHGLDDEGMISEILRKVSALEDINDATSERVLIWALQVEAQRVQKEVLDSIKEAKDFDSIRHNMQKQNNKAHKKQRWVENCRYC